MHMSACGSTACVSARACICVCVCNNVIVIVIIINCTANGFLPGGSGTTIRHSIKIHISHKISHHAQTKHSTQSTTKMWKYPIFHLKSVLNELDIS
jgi:hypothetical protein